MAKHATMEHRFNYMLNRKKNLYVRIGKTGSTSLSTSFDNNVIEVTPSLKYKKIYDKHSYKFRFTFIRNPYDRIVSAYYMLTKSKLAKDHYLAIKKEDILDISFNKFIKKVIHLRDTHQHLGIRKEKNIHLRPWKNKKEIEKNRLGHDAYWILAHTEGMLDSIQYFTPLSTIDFIGRYESLSEDFNRLGDFIGLKKELGHLNASTSRKRYADYYDNESLELVTKIYKTDLELFNYTFDDQKSF